MNHDEILALSGPQLSEAVARHVMGWEPVVLGNSYEDVGTVWDADGKWKLIPRVPFRKKDGGLFAIVMEVWEPHSDTDHATGLITANDAVMAVFRGGMWLVRWTGAYTSIADKQCVQSSSKSLAIAICQAALLAKLASSV